MTVICKHCEAEIHQGAVCIRLSVTEEKKKYFRSVVVFLAFEVVSGLNTFVLCWDAGAVILLCY